MHGGGASVWAEITALGRMDGMVNLGQGFPDFPCSQAASNGAVLSLQVRALRNFSGVCVRVQCRLPCRQEGTTSTRLSKGRRDARLLWPKCTNTNAAAHARPSPVHSVSNVRLACSYARLYPSRPLNAATEVCVMTSGTEALFCCIMALIDPGDEVVFFEPFFPWCDAQRPPGHYDTTTLTNTAPARPPVRTTGSDRTGNAGRRAGTCRASGWREGRQSPFGSRRPRSISCPSKYSLPPAHHAPLYPNSTLYDWMGTHSTEYS